MYTVLKLDPRVLFARFFLSSYNTKVGLKDKSNFFSNKRGLKKLTIAIIPFKLIVSLFTTPIKPYIFVFFILRSSGDTFPPTVVLIGHE